MKKISWMMAALLTCTACVPIPQHFYMPVRGQGRILHSYCNPHLVEGVAFTREGVEINVTMGRNHGRDYVQIWFQVPGGKTLLLQEHSIWVSRNGSAPQESPFPNVSPSDRPIVNSYSTDPRWQKEMLPVTAALVGATTREGSITSDRNFWIAAYVNPDKASDIWVRLPRFTVNGTPVAIAPIHLERRLDVLIAKFNC